MKKLIALLITMSCIFVLSCGGITYYATVTLANESDYEVTNIRFIAVGVDKDGERTTLSLLNPGEEKKLNVEWFICGGNNNRGSFTSIISYNINGETYNVKDQEDAIQAEHVSGNIRFFSPRTIQDGSVARIVIKNEGYEFTISKGEVLWDGKEGLGFIEPPKK